MSLMGSQLKLGMSVFGYRPSFPAEGPLLTDTVEKVGNCQGRRALIHSDH